MDSRRHVNMPRGNRGLPFKALRVVLRSGEEFDGIRCEDETSHEHLAVWDTNGDDVLPRLLRWSDVSDVTPIPESPVPESVFERIRPDPPTGGIGEHIRWCIDVPKPRKGALVKLLVSDFETDERRRQLWDFVERTDGVAFHGNRPDVFVNSECGAHIVTLELDDRSAVGDFTQHLIWKLAQMGISSHAPGCQRDIAPDRIDDFKRRWSAHDAAQRGPRCFGRCARRASTYRAPALARRSTSSTRRSRASRRAARGRRRRPTSSSRSRRTTSRGARSRPVRPTSFQSIAAATGFSTRAPRSRQTPRTAG